MILYIISWDIEAIYILGKLPEKGKLYKLSNHSFAYITRHKKKYIKKELKKVLENIQKNNISLIVNIGIAGSINKNNIKKYHIYPISSVIYFPTKEIIQIPTKLYEMFKSLRMQPKKLLTVNNPILQADNKTKYYLSKITDLVDMEFFHIAKLTKELNIQAISFKSISDFLDDITPIDIIRATNNLKNFLSPYF
jgi:hypothetical protein